MRYKLTHNSVISFAKRRYILLAAFLPLLTACKDGRVDELLVQVARLESQLNQQAALIRNLQSAQSEHQLVLSRLSEWEHVKFAVTDVQFEVVEKAFEPLVMGQAKLNLLGDSKPPLIFMEWALMLSVKGDPLEPVTYIQRVENGVAQLTIAYPLPRHNIKAKDLTVTVKPTGWYQAHVAQLADDSH